MNWRRQTRPGPAGCALARAINVLTRREPSFVPAYAHIPSGGHVLGECCPAQDAARAAERGNIKIRSGRNFGEKSGADTSGISAGTFAQSFSPAAGVRSTQAPPEVTPTSTPPAPPPVAAPRSPPLPRDKYLIRSQCSGPHVSPAASALFRTGNPDGAPAPSPASAPIRYYPTSTGPRHVVTQ